jgi:hypothetical protein
VRNTFRRMNALAYQLEQAYAEGILSKTVMENILDKLQDDIEGSIQKEQYQQLQEWLKSSGQLQLDDFREIESEEEIIYREYVKSLPEGL